MRSGDYVTPLQSGAQRMFSGRAMNNLPAATMITSSQRKKLCPKEINQVLFKKRRKVMKFASSGVITYKKPDWKFSCVPSEAARRGEKWEARKTLSPEWDFCRKQSAKR